MKMHWRCEICNKIMYENSRNNHLQSGFHKCLATLIFRKYIISNPKSTKIDDTVRKFLRSHY